MDSSSATAVTAPSSILVATATRSTATSLSAQRLLDIGLGASEPQVSRRHASSVGSEESVSASESVEVEDMSGLIAGGDGGAGGYAMSYGKPHMPMFDGRDDVHSFLDKLEIYFNYSGVMDKDKRANVSDVAVAWAKQDSNIVRRAQGGCEQLV